MKKGSLSCLFRSGMLRGRFGLFGPIFPGGLRDDLFHDLSLGESGDIAEVQENELAGARDGDIDVLKAFFTLLLSLALLSFGNLLAASFQGQLLFIRFVVGISLAHGVTLLLI